MAAGTAGDGTSAGDRTTAGATRTGPPGVGAPRVEAGGERAIRVFVSSTFRDMQAEREELVKRVFPIVRRMCEGRGVVWSEVDLRWGVTDEQKAEGAVLPICLAEIDRSRPYFLGLLGQRYGWVPEELPDGLADQLPWLAALDGTSVTEMEVLHGVLNDPGAAGHAFFHLRDPAWVDTRPPEERLLLGEVPGDDEVATLGPEAAEAAAARRRARLEELKDRVRASGFPAQEYADPADLGRQVLAELTALVDDLFPPDEVPDGVARADEAHRAFGRARLAGSLERPAITAELDAHAAGTGGPLVLRSEPGSDATPLVAGWLEAWRAAHPGDVVVQHHVGATADSTSWRDLAQRVVATVRAATDPRSPAPASTAMPPDAAGLRAGLFSAFARAGTLAPTTAATGAPHGGEADGRGTSRRFVVVVDGADLLDDVDGAPDLTWLPADLPPGVRVVVTTSGPRPAEAAARAGWLVVDLPELDPEERAAFIAAFLARWSKGLDPVHVEHLVASPHTGNVLYLRTVLDELRQHGDHFTLGDVIAHHLAAETVDDLLELVLARYERDFEADRPGLVGDAFRAIWAARRGITEAELLGLLGGEADGGEPLPHASWSPLVLAAEAGLVTRSGLIGFATDGHRKAVGDRYLADDRARRAAHASLAHHFAARPLGPRVVEELPWQQLDAGDVDGLVATISDLAYVDVAYPHAPEDLRRLWARAQEHGRSVVDAYRTVIDDPAGHPDALWAVARLVTDAGHPTEALVLHRALVDRYRGLAAADPDPASRAQRRLRGSLLNLGAALSNQGDLPGSEAATREAIALARPAGDDVVLGSALGNLGLAREAQGDLAGAEAQFAEAEAVARRQADLDLLQAALGNRAGVQRRMGRYAEALSSLAEQERVCRSVGDQRGLGLALAGQAAIHGDTGDPAGALAAIEAWRVAAVEAGDRTGQAEAMVSEAATLRQLGRGGEAAPFAAAAEQLARQDDDPALLARALDAQGRAAIDEGRWEEARRLGSEAARTARRANLPTALVLALGTLGMAQRELGDLPAAQASHAEELQVATEIGDPAAVAAAHVNLAAVSIKADDATGALAHYAQAEPVLRQLGAAMLLVPLLQNRWQVHAAIGDHAAAIADLVDCGAQCATIGAEQQRAQVLLQAVALMGQTGQQARAEPVLVSLVEACQRSADDAGLQRAYGELAMVRLGRGDLDGAAQLLDQQESICTRIGDQVGLAACVGNRAILRQQQGDLPGSLACLDQQLALAQASGNAQGVLFATANRGEVLGDLGRIPEALAALAQARQMAVQWNVAAMLPQLDQMIAQLEDRRG